MAHFSPPSRSEDLGLEHNLLSLLTFDDNDREDTFLERFMYDDYFKLALLTADELSSPKIFTTPTPKLPSYEEVVQQTRNAMTHTSSRKRNAVLVRDELGKLGVRFTRVGSRMFFSYVERYSNAAKCGLGFGDQLLAIEGMDIGKLSGTQLMSLLAQSPAKQFKFTVFLRPFDYILDGEITAKMELSYSTKDGKPLGSVNVESVAENGCIKKLKLLCVNEHRVFSWKKRLLMSLFQTLVGVNIELRVMPVILYNRLLSRRDIEHAISSLQLSPRIL